MTGHTYLLKSRHGVYYFRATIPLTPQTRDRKRREVRISLRTKDRTLAKRLVAEKVYIMSKPIDDPQAESDREDALFDLGQTVASRIGRVDTDDHRAVHAMCEHLTDIEIEAYLFYCTYVEEQEDRRRAKQLGLTTHRHHSPSHALGSAPVQQATTAEAPASPKTDALLADVIERYVESTKNSVKNPTADKYGTHCQLFSKVIAAGRDGLRLSKITISDMHNYVDTLPRLKKRILPNEPWPLPLVKPRSDDAMLPATIFAHATGVQRFLRWCEKQHYHLTPNLSSVLEPLLIKPKTGANQRLSFSDVQLRTLFESRNYLAGSFKRPSDYWVPLLGLFTGAREGELCQLLSDDVYQDESTGIWIIDINAEDGKSLKSKDSSPRLIPIHPQLIELGFLEYRELAVEQKQERMFPHEERNKRGEFSAFSKRFNRFKELLDIRPNKKQRLDFHSFRHTVANLLVGQGIEEYVVNDITGHSNARRSEAFATYSKSAFLQTKRDAIAKLSYEIDFSSIKPNGFTWKPGAPARDDDE